MQIGGVKYGNHQNSQHVIDNRDRRQKDFQAEWHPITKQGQASKCERNIGGDWHTPSAQRWEAVIE